MSVFNEQDIETPRTVSVDRPGAVFTDDGDSSETLDPVITSMIVDIQLSLQVRHLVSETKTGVSGDEVWVMYCRPQVPIEGGDRVSDDLGRTFVVDAAADWGTHTECVLRGLSPV